MAKKATDTDEAYAEGFEEGAAAAAAGEVDGEALAPETQADNTAVDARRYRHARDRGLIHSDRVFTHNEVEHHPQKLQPDAADAFIDWDLAQKT